MSAPAKLPFYRRPPALATFLVYAVLGCLAVSAVVVVSYHTHLQTQVGHARPEK